MKKAIIFLGMLAVSPALASEHSIGVKIGGGGISGTQAEQASDLQFGFQLDYSYFLTSNYAVELGMIANGSMPIISALFDDKTASYSSYFTGVRASHNISTNWSIYAKGGVGFAVVEETGLGKNSDYNETIAKLSPYVGIGTEYRLSENIALSSDIRFDSLPSNYQGTSLMLGINFYI
ncbi:outer membrane beta-barrel protein [Photobacterium swingsii]|uniref:outer membrane beta-barrel protein n=1 Tax=Photobacterium swingsii TaxID=680026 RepID=UPI004068CCF3